MPTRRRPYTEKSVVKTKIIATVGPACAEKEQLLGLVQAGVDVFRLNFAHGDHDWLAGIVRSIREIEEELDNPLAILGDLSGPKIRLGELPAGGIYCVEGEIFEFVRGSVVREQRQLTCTYEHLVDDLKVGDPILLADGSVAMQVQEKLSDRLVCQVKHTGTIRSRQGVNLPGVALRTPCLTEKDKVDLDWALDQQLDYIGLSFVRTADDVHQLRKLIEQQQPVLAPAIVSKIEKLEALEDLEKILQETDAIMVARGDLGVEADITRVPVLQKQIIQLCNDRRIPVITATQMLDTMQTNELPTRAEASDVANAVLDGTDAVMLSGETAIGQYPRESVAMMSRLAHEAERLVQANRTGEWEKSPRTRSLVVTEAVTIGARTAAEYLNADLIVVVTRTGRTAMAVSRQRGKVPILALTDQVSSSRRMCLYWGVTPQVIPSIDQQPSELLKFMTEWGETEQVLQPGSRVVLVGSSEWPAKGGHNLMLIHAIP